MLKKEGEAKFKLRKRRKGLLLRLLRQRLEIRRRSVASTWGESFEKQGGAIRALSCGKVGSRGWSVSRFRLFKELGEEAMEFERGSEIREIGRSDLLDGI